MAFNEHQIDIIVSLFNGDFAFLREKVDWVEEINKRLRAKTITDSKKGEVRVFKTRHIKKIIHFFQDLNNIYTDSINATTVKCYFNKEAGVSEAVKESLEKHTKIKSASAAKLKSSMSVKAEDSFDSSSNSKAVSPEWRPTYSPSKELLASVYKFVPYPYIEPISSRVLPNSGDKAAAQNLSASDLPLNIDPPVTVMDMLKKLGQFIESHYSADVRSSEKPNKSLKVFEDQFANYKSFFDLVEIEASYQREFDDLPSMDSENYVKELQEYERVHKRRQANIKCELKALENFERLYSQLKNLSAPTITSEQDEVLLGAAELMRRVSKNLEEVGEKLDQVRLRLNEVKPSRNTLMVLLDKKKIIKADLLSTLTKLYGHCPKVHLLDEKYGVADPASMLSDLDVLTASLQGKDLPFTPENQIIDKFRLRLDGKSGFTFETRELFYKQILDVIDYYDYVLQFDLPKDDDPEKLRALLLNISTRIHRVSLKIKAMRDNLVVRADDAFYVQALKGLNEFLGVVNQALYFECKDKSSLVNEVTTLFNHNCSETKEFKMDEAIETARQSIKVMPPPAPRSLLDNLAFWRRWKEQNRETEKNTRERLYEILTSKAVLEETEKLEVKTDLNNAVPDAEKSEGKVDSNKAVSDVKQPEKKKPYHTSSDKLKACRKLIEKTRPSIFKFWRSEENDRYTKLKQEVARICHVQAFVDGEIDEGRFLAEVALLIRATDNTKEQANLEALYNKLHDNWVKNSWLELENVNTIIADSVQKSEAKSGSFGKVHQRLIGEDMPEDVKGKAKIEIEDPKFVEKSSFVGPLLKKSRSALIEEKPTEAKTKAAIDHRIQKVLRPMLQL